MADRIADVPDDAEWPELEEELIAGVDPVPDAGAFEDAFEHLHGARATLESDLVEPTRVLTVVAARCVLRAVERADTTLDDDQREAFERIADGQVPDESEALLEELADLTLFVETNLELEPSEQDA